MNINSDIWYVKIKQTARQLENAQSNVDFSELFHSLEFHSKCYKIINPTLYSEWRRGDVVESVPKGRSIGGSRLSWSLRWSVVFLTRNFTSCCLSLPNCNGLASHPGGGSYTLSCFMWQNKLRPCGPSAVRNIATCIDSKTKPKKKEKATGIIKI